MSCLIIAAGILMVDKTLVALPEFAECARCEQKMGLAISRSTVLKRAHDRECYVGSITARIKSSNCDATVCFSSAFWCRRPNSSELD